MPNIDRNILIDADVISHFITAGEHLIIDTIFPNNKILLLDKVHAELQNWPSTKMLIEVSTLLSKGKVKVIPFPEEDEDIKREYFNIKKQMFKGDGESACLAVAKYQKNILASSNLRDIAHYCKTHKIDYLTTMDFLCEALRVGLFTEQRCNDFISAVLKSKSKLPVQNMQGYTCREIAFV